MLVGYKSFSIKMQLTGDLQKRTHEIYIFEWVDFDGIVLLPSNNTHNEDGARDIPEPPVQPQGHLYARIIKKILSRIVPLAALLQIFFSMDERDIFLII